MTSPTAPHAPSPLPPDTGRPDTAELSRVLLRGLLEAAGADVSGLGGPQMLPTRRTLTTPRGAQELVPGDIDALRDAAALLEGRAPDAPGDLVEAAAVAHRTLAEAIADLRVRAEALYRRSAELGVGEELWAGGTTLRDRIAQHPEDAEELASVARAAAELRVAWDGAQIDFIEDLAAVREAFGIPLW